MWRLRIENELLDSKSAIFFTGTFSDGVFSPSNKPALASDPPIIAEAGHLVKGSVAFLQHF